ncbi:MAG TPA: cytochrome c [Gemmataceae bacterium]|jgi:mono/diheme cytochrome c family protein|nr:cytochrome c [Gemmataceae bacterium]
MIWLRNNQFQKKTVRSELDFRSLCSPLTFILFLGAIVANLEGSLPKRAYASLEKNIQESEAPAREEGPTPVNGGILYRRYCSRCHGSDGRGLSKRALMPLIPDFTESSWQKSRSNPQLEVTILEGQGRSMPAFGQRLKDEEVRVLVAYIRTFGPYDFAQPSTAVSEFDWRYRLLQEELNELRQQFRELSDSSKPAK